MVKKLMLELAARLYLAMSYGDHERAIGDAIGALRESGCRCPHMAYTISAGRAGVRYYERTYSVPACAEGLVDKIVELAERRGFFEEYDRVARGEC